MCWWSNNAIFNIEIDRSSRWGTHACVLLAVVPDTDYSQTVLILLGTNVLSEFLDKCKGKTGVNFLQKAALHTGTHWYLLGPSIHILGPRYLAFTVHLVSMHTLNVSVISGKPEVHLIISL